MVGFFAWMVDLGLWMVKYPLIFDPVFVINF